MSMQTSASVSVRSAMSSQPVASRLGIPRRALQGQPARQKAADGLEGLATARRLGHHLGGFDVFPSAAVVQPKLMIGPVDDPYEREADSMAQQVVRRMYDGSAAAASATGTVQDDEEDETPVVRKKAQGHRQDDSASAAAPDLESAIHQSRGSGQSLSESTRRPMEQAFGANFGAVRVHTDAQADQLNRSIQARAFTTGQDIFMRQGEYRPQERSGQELLAHELTHVVQQTQVHSPAIQRMLWSFSNNVWRDRDWQVGNPQGLPLLNPQTNKPWKDYDVWDDGLDQEEDAEAEVEHPEFTEQWANAHGYAYDRQLSPQVGERYDKAIGNAGGAHKPKGRILVHRSGNYAISTDQDEHAGQAWKAHYKVRNQWAYAGTYDGTLQKLQRPVGTGPAQLP